MFTYSCSAWLSFFTSTNRFFDKVQMSGFRKWPLTTIVRLGIQDEHLKAQKNSAFGRIVNHNSTKILIKYCVNNRNYYIPIMKVRLFMCFIHSLVESMSRESNEISARGR